MMAPALASAPGPGKTRSRIYRTKMFVFPAFPDLTVSLPYPRPPDGRAAAGPERPIGTHDCGMTWAVCECVTTDVGPSPNRLHDRLRFIPSGSWRV
jgi:hypothetical protein